MRKPTLAVAFLALALASCDPTFIEDVKLDPRAASFEPSPFTVGVGRSEGLTLRLSDTDIDEVSLRCPAAALTLSAISCEPASSCTIVQHEVVGTGQGASLTLSLTLRRTSAITMQVSGLSAGGSYVSANVWRHRSCDFVGFCTEPAESFASVTVHVVP